MTEFEQKIAEFVVQGVRHLLSCAVRNPSPGGDYLALCNCGRDDALALRVADAINDVAQEFVDLLDQCGGSALFDNGVRTYDAADAQRELYNAALSALRGETP